MLILWILIGALCGWIAALLSRTGPTANISFYLTVGIIGSLIGGLVAQAYGSESIFFNPLSLLLALVASGAMLVIARLFLRRA